MENATKSNIFPNRRSIRYENYDYSSEGVYFVTLVTHHKHVFRKIENGVMHLNEFGEIVRQEWFKSAILKPTIKLNEDEFVVMPNHIHRIILITEQIKEITDNGHGTGDLQVAHTNSTNPFRPNGPISNSVGAIIAGFKSATTKKINNARNSYGQPVWLRNYYEHIIETDPSRRLQRFGGAQIAKRILQHR